MKKKGRIVEVLVKEGFGTFCYLVREKLRERQRPQRKYRTWIKRHEKALAGGGLENPPLFSVVLIGSGKEQKSLASLKRVDYEALEVIRTEEKETLGHLLERTKGEYIGFLRRGDILTEDGLQRVARELTKPCVAADKGRPQLVYTDEDRIDANGGRTDPWFKPDYSPDTLRSFFYMGGFLLCKRELLDKLTYSLQQPICFDGYLVALEASLVWAQEDRAYVEGDGPANQNDYGCGHRQRAYHISQVLYHRLEAEERKDIAALAAGKKALFRMYGMEVDTEPVQDCEEVRIVYKPETNPEVSIIIPSKDNPAMLETCLCSIDRFTRYQNCEIIVVDNGSTGENRSRYQALCDRQRFPCRYLYEPMEFNFSRMCNLGASSAAGEYYLFLNDDIEITDAGGADWIMRMLGQAMQPHTGAVGAKLLYPGTNRIQHIGFVNYESGAAHILSKETDDVSRLFSRNRLEYNYMMVTGACMMLSKKKFAEAGGFLEDLAVTFNDVELCFRLFRLGYYQVVRNDVVLYHHESITRGEDAVDQAKYHRHLKEREKLFALHPFLVKRDFFYSPYLTQRDLGGGINVQKRQESFEVIRKGGESISNQPGDRVVCAIECVQEECETVCVRGYAFLRTYRHNNWNRTYLVLKGERETLYVRAAKRYNPTIAPQRKSSLNLNFVEFYVILQKKRLKASQYQIGVMICPFASRKRYLKLTGKNLKISGKYEKNI